jgi:ribonuclease P protein component
VAFAINRAYGPAVRRNRLRRRLRAVLHDLDRRRALPPGMMIIGLRPGTQTELAFDTVASELTELIDRVRASTAEPCSV